MDMTNETTPPIETGEQPTGESLAPRPAAKRTVPQKPKKPRVGGAPSDPLADMLTRVRNGAGARHETVTIPASRTKLEVEDPEGRGLHQLFRPADATRDRAEDEIHR